MKKLSINGKDLEYEVFHHISEFGDYYETVFYEGTTIKTYKKYWLFGETITKIVPKEVFVLYVDIESRDYTKDKIRGMIEKKLALLNREEEIKNGKII